METETLEAEAAPPPSPRRKRPRVHRTALSGASCLLLMGCASPAAPPETTARTLLVEPARELAGIPGARVEREPQLIRVTLPGDLLFEGDTEELAPDAHAPLRRVAEILRRHPDTSVVIQGHMDPDGPEQYNVERSRADAEAVRQFLIVQGVAPDRLATMGLGGAYAPEPPRPGALRRIEFEIRPREDGARGTGSGIEHHPSAHDSGMPGVDAAEGGST